MSTADIKANRPLSPHLQIYRWPLTMVVSILHRITGAGLYVGSALLAWWLIAAATSEPAFGFINRLLGSWLGLVVLFGFSLALIHHMLGGLRHLFWDFGVGLDKPARDRLALANLIGSVGLTIAVWAVGLWIR